MLLLLGGNGSIGTRYKTILEYLNKPFIIHDSPTEKFDYKMWEGKLTRAIVATPTEAHTECCLELIKWKIPFLCEKPLTKKADEAFFLQKKAEQQNVPAHIVCNYSFLLGVFNYPKLPKYISYDFFNTGKDGLIWDVCQLVYMAYSLQATLRAEKKSYYWHFTLDDKDVMYRHIEESYLMMVRAFMNGAYDLLWNMQDAVKMTQICEQLTKYNKSKKELYYKP